MAVMRINKTSDYTVMSNRHFKEKNMTLKAKGLLSLMLSLPDTWDYSINGLVAICKENESAIKSTLAELREFGYLTITKRFPNETDTGRIEYIYDIFEQPQQKQAKEKQGVENLGVENQPVENPPQLNTKPSNTKKENTNKEKYIAVIDYLNAKAGTAYRAASKATQQHINARLAEGFTVEDFQRVIDNKCADWLGSEWEQYLRPSTLFGSKFEQYLNSKPKQAKGANGIAVSSSPSDLDGVF